MVKNKRYVFVGIQGSGKTTACLKVAIASKKRIMVLDDVVHEAYSSFERISQDDIATWKGQNCVVDLVNLDDALIQIGYHQANVFLIIEDSARYIESHVSNAVKTICINHRKINIDIAFMFHFLGEVPPYICKVFNRMVVFKTGDNMEVKQQKFLEWHTIVEKHKKVMKSKDANACCVIDKG